jgi:hypothetical protein
MPLQPLTDVVGRRFHARWLPERPATRQRCGQPASRPAIPAQQVHSPDLARRGRLAFWRARGDFPIQPAKTEPALPAN